MTASPLAALTRWARAQPAPGGVELLCAELPSPATADPNTLGVRLDGCLADAHPVDVLELAAAGLDRIVVHPSGCRAPERLASLLDQVSALLQASTWRGRLEVDPPGGRIGRHTRPRPEYPIDRLPVPRRALLGLTVLRPSSPDPVGRRDRIEAATAVLGIVHGPDVPSRFRELSASGCGGCGVCARACPATALRVATQPGGTPNSHRRRLIVDPLACGGCLRCLEVCPRDALSAGRHLTWAELLADGRPQTLAVVDAATCERCHAPVPPGERWCEVCSFRRANPFGSAAVGGSPVRAQPGR